MPIAGLGAPPPNVCANQCTGHSSKVPIREGGHRHRRRDRLVPVLGHHRFGSQVDEGRVRRRFDDAVPVVGGRAGHVLGREPGQRGGRLVVPGRHHPAAE
ncbi:hypothetical protein [Curtobacterium sp. MCPF17_052]|uniref:hypothetical protein n=1 Tax=Curtobacterium sp. MCPF17_052 TaxID=2175655 RepID=UPI0024DF941B|nr:hypothetical protein [Curtobacterium sp. MCPF17_052]WIB12055.1 hypothetical protein DEJ36_14805 [Curtobacterium sp. MCPF17_052]